MKTKSYSPVLRLTVNAMFVAIYVLLACVLTIRTPITEFSLCTVPIFLCAFLFGFRDAILVALAGSLIEQLVSPYGITVTLPLWMLPVILVAVFAGLMAKLPKRSVALTVVTVIAGEILFTVCNTAALYLDSLIMVYPVSTLAVLVPQRTVNLGIRAACTVWLVPLLTLLLDKVLPAKKS